MIRSKLLKKVLSTALALSLIMAPVMGVNASTTSSAPVSSETSGTTSSKSAVTSEEAVVIPTTSSVTVNGQVLRTTIRGAYMSQLIPGTVVITAKAALAESYGLTALEQPYVRIYDISAKNSPLALASVNAVAEAIGAKVVATANMELGKLAAGKFTLLAQDGAPITMVFGIPKVEAGYAYAVICVRPGGSFEILSDLDADPATVTFNTAGGLGAYAIVAYPAG